MRRIAEEAEGRAGWLLVGLLSAYILYATIDWRVPAPGGWPFGVLWAALTVLLVGATRLVRRQIGPTPVLAAAAVAGMILTDVTMFWSQGLRDFHLYLKAGEHYLAGTPVYLTSLLTTRPADLTNYPFLYPPMLLPAFAVVAVIPRLVADVAWVSLSAGLSVAGLRALGLPTRWAIAALLWPPFAEGLYVGNVSLLIFGLFTFGPWVGSGLVVSGVFKIYDAIAAVWLVREGRWASVALGTAVLGAIALVTLPLTGLGLWLDWLRGLDWYAKSQSFLPGSLYGIGLDRYAPDILAIILGVAVTLVALRVHGREGLARLGAATVVASPSLYAHGFLLAVPALLRLRPALLWLAIGITSVAPGIGWWAAIALALAAWGLPALRLPATAEAGAAKTSPAAGAPGDAARSLVGDADCHPLGRGGLLWPNMPDEPIDERAGRERLRAGAARADSAAS